MRRFLNSLEEFVCISASSFRVFFGITFECDVYECEEIRKMYKLLLTLKIKDGDEFAIDLNILKFLFCFQYYK